MRILSPNDPFPECRCALTIGTFDGVHLGHTALFKRLNSFQVPSVVVTFTSHPSQLFTPQKRPQNLSTTHQKLDLLQKHQIDYVYLLPFTQELVETPFDTFLQQLHKKFSFSYLLLGKGAKLGHKKEGNEEKIRQLAPSMGFLPEFIDLSKSNENALSSTNIRKAIFQGDLKTAEKFLGRPYSITPKDASRFVLPPAGNYSVIVRSPGDEAHSELTVLDQEKGLIELKAPLSNLSEIIF